MRFSTIIVSLALAVGLAIAGPVSGRDDSDPGLDPVDGVAAPPFDPVDPESRSLEADVTIPPKREDYNPLDERASSILILCPKKSCKGKCWGYNIGHLKHHWCYHSSPYSSTWISSHSGDQGIYVGPHCPGMFTKQVFMH